MSFESKLTLKNCVIDGGLRKKKIFKKNESNFPLITVITAVLNGERHLEEAIKSLHKQNYRNIEHIIIDGCSTDNTINIIKKYEHKIDYWCQVKDKGIYDAFNIGMQLSNGSYLGFLNSDDVYSPNAFDILTSYLKKYPEKDFIFGSVQKHWGVLHGYKPLKINWSATILLLSLIIIYEYLKKKIFFNLSAQFGAMKSKF